MADDFEKNRQQGGQTGQQGNQPGQHGQKGQTGQGGNKTGSPDNRRKATRARMKKTTNSRTGNVARPSWAVS
jgi:hypothetical protein